MLTKYGQRLIMLIMLHGIVNILYGIDYTIQHLVFCGKVQRAEVIPPCVFRAHQGLR